MSRYNLNEPSSSEEMTDLVVEALDFYGSEDNGCSRDSSNMIYGLIEKIRAGEIIISIGSPGAKPPLCTA